MTSTPDVDQEFQSLVSRLSPDDLQAWRAAVDADLYKNPELEKLLLRERLDQALAAAAPR